MSIEHSYELAHEVLLLAKKHEKLVKKFFSYLDFKFASSTSILPIPLEIGMHIASCPTTSFGMTMQLAGFIQWKINDFDLII